LNPDHGSGRIVQVLSIHLNLRQQKEAACS